jgi:hypothetical protein
VATSTAAKQGAGSGLRRHLRFPDPVDEVSARLVAGGALALAAVTLATQLWPLAVLLAYGFVARALAGPRFSPLALLMTRVVRPRLAVPARPVPGPPKRFAQGMGAVMSVTIAVLALVFDQTAAASVLLIGLGTAAALEAAFGFCLGCRIHALLARAGVVQECADCADIGDRLARAADRTRR